MSWIPPPPADGFIWLTKCRPFGSIIFSPLRGSSYNYAALSIPQPSAGKCVVPLPPFTPPPPSPAFVCHVYIWLILCYDIMICNPLRGSSDRVVISPRNIANPLSQIWAGSDTSSSSWALFYAQTNPCPLHSNPRKAGLWFGPTCSTPPPSRKVRCVDCIIA